MCHLVRIRSRPSCEVIMNKSSSEFVGFRLLFVWEICNLNMVKEQTRNNHYLLDLISFEMIFANKTKGLVRSFYVKSPVSNMMAIGDLLEDQSFSDNILLLGVF